ncbi:MBL fold metallo-hydrolase [Polaromonas hydrogenivorans]|uniref:MBL fold metallo-hydrolase n=1 Tax=Polaromonas hydrogenivorans TaxID=335476 RepID=A0AAU7LT18_9BURK
MHHFIQRVGLSMALSTLALAAQGASLQSAAESLGATRIQSIEFSGGGKWFQFGQAPAPELPWPRFDVSRYTASIHYDSASARVQLSRLQTLEPDRVRPAPIEQNLDQYVSGARAWNQAVAPAATTVTPQPAAAEERAAEIWATPQGFLKAALANQAQSRPLKDGGVEVSFKLGGKYRYVGLINARDEVEEVRTWIDNPVLGDTLVETTFSHYEERGGVRFPAHIVRTQGGHRVLDLAVSEVKVNRTAPLLAPEAAASAPAVTVTVNKLADGVFYLSGGSHHSVAIEQRDHVVLVEAPLDEARSQAVIKQVKATIPGKPIKYLINTHAHFDHSGGLRSYVAEGATIVTHQDNIAYYRAAWAGAHTLNPDRLAKSHKPARFAGFTDKHVLTDGQRRIEVHTLAGNTHNDAFALVYLPAEKILIEGDAYTPLAAGAKPPAQPNPYSVNLLDNVKKLKLDVARIAPLHGQLATLADLRAAVGQDVAGK